MISAIGSILSLATICGYGSLLIYNNLMERGHFKAISCSKIDKILKILNRYKRENIDILVWCDMHDECGYRHFNNEKINALKESISKNNFKDIFYLDFKKYNITFYKDLIVVDFIERNLI